MDIYELYYINKISPKFNIATNRKDDISTLDLKELVFKKYKYELIEVSIDSGDFKEEEVYDLEYYEENYMIRYLGYKAFRFYCDLIYLLEISNNIPQVDFAFKDGRSINKNLKILQKYGIIKYEKIGTLYKIKPINLLLKDYILKMKDDFYENLTLTDSCWVVYFMSYCYEYLNLEFNPFCNLDNVHYTIRYCTYMGDDTLDKNIEYLKSIGYNFEVNYKNSLTYKLCNVYEEYHCLTNSMWDNETYRQNRLSKFEEGFKYKYNRLLNEFHLENWGMSYEDWKLLRESEKEETFFSIPK
jgi:hypothetical protein